MKDNNSDQKHCFRLTFFDHGLYGGLDKLKKHIIEMFNPIYFVAGIELCPTTKREHLQAYIHFGTKRKTFGSAKKTFFPWQPTILPCNASAEANRGYCTKDLNIWWEHGECPKPGSRNDIKALKEAVMNGGEILDMIDDETIKNYQHMKIAEKLIPYYKPKRNKEAVQVLWFYGSAGSGKTVCAWDLYEDSLYEPLSSKWFDGYQGEETILIDDFREDWIRYDDLLKLLDRYPIKKECKGGMVWLRHKRIVITAPMHPGCYYNHMNEDNKQLLRRITEIREF